MAARRMDPPRKPKDSDSSKRKAELAEAHHAELREPLSATHAEIAEWDSVFKDY